MQLKLYVLVFFVLCSAIIRAMSIDSTITDTSEEMDTLKVKYSGNETIWGFGLGYFPIWDDYFESSGIAVTLYSESSISKLFNLGWSFQLNKAIGSNGGYLSLNGFLSHPIKMENHAIYIKGGLGLATLIYPSLVGLVEFQYMILEFEKTAISISVFECIPGFQMLLPPVISIGILF